MVHELRGLVWPVNMWPLCCIFTNLFTGVVTWSVISVQWSMGLHGSVSGRRRVTHCTPALCFNTISSPLLFSSMVSVHHGKIGIFNVRLFSNSAVLRIVHAWEAINMLVWCKDSQVELSWPEATIDNISTTTNKYLVYDFTDNILNSFKIYLIALPIQSTVKWSYKDLRFPLSGSSTETRLIHSSCVAISHAAKTSGSRHYFCSRKLSFVKPFTELSASLLNLQLESALALKESLLRNGFSCKSSSAIFEDYFQDTHLLHSNKPIDALCFAR